MKRLRLPALMMVPALLALAAGVYAATNFQVNPSRFDPGHTFLVQATWLDGIGCPTNAKVANPNADFTGVSGTSPYTDPACPTGDQSDQRNQGLLLAKTGPTTNFAAGQAEVKGVKGTMLTELGYDIRKPASAADPRGSHCGAGAPRFDITTEDGTTYFLGCNSPTPVQTSNGSPGWLRLRWGGSAGPLMAFGPAGLVDISKLKVKSVFIIFDEGQDTGPDNFGIAVLDNIDVNGTLIGHGNAGKDTDGHGKGKGHDNGDDDNGNNDQGGDD